MLVNNGNYGIIATALIYNVVFLRKYKKKEGRSYEKKKLLQSCWQACWLYLLQLAENQETDLLRMRLLRRIKLRRKLRKK